jgi:hypothetical protein
LASGPLIDPAGRLNRSSKNPAGPGRGIEERHGAGFGVSVFPGMRHAAWHEDAGARPTDRELVADLEGDFAAQHVGHLVTVVGKVDVVSVPAGPVSSNSMTLLPVSSPTAPPPSLIYKAHVRIPGARCGNLQTRERLGRPNADASSNFRWRVAVAPVATPPARTIADGRYYHLGQHKPSPPLSVITSAGRSHRRWPTRLAPAWGKPYEPAIPVLSDELLCRFVRSASPKIPTIPPPNPGSKHQIGFPRPYIFPAQKLKGHRKKIIGLISQITVMKCIDVSLAET